MVQLITQGIKIAVITEFEGAFLKNFSLQYAFSYQVSITNNSKDTVQLISRHWEISDALQQTEIVDGEGVIGQKPVILPGETHVYQSGCSLLSMHGSMLGHYNMINFTTTRNFKVLIPSFKLNVPFALN